MKLLWSGPHLKESAIPMSSLFSSNQSPVLKLARLPATTTDIGFLFPGIQPFLDRKNLWIGDLSPELENAKIVRQLQATQQAADQTLEFDINTPARLFVSHEKHQSIPLESCGEQTVSFKPTEFILSLYKATSSTQRYATH